MQSYTQLAALYDKLAADYNYKQWVECALSLYNTYHPGGAHTARVLDLGCGTGKATAEMAQRGLWVTGVDASPDMLSMALQRLENVEPSPQLLCQDMRELNLGVMRCQLVVALCDTFNYLVTKEDLAKTMQNVAQVLEPGGVLVFDLNTAHKLATVYGNNTYIEEDSDFFIAWENRWQPRKRICTMELNIFMAAGSAWRRTTEVHVERAHNHSEVVKALTDAGFTQVQGPLAAFDLNEPHEQTERVFYAAQVPFFS